MDPDLFTFYLWNSRVCSLSLIRNILLYFINFVLYLVQVFSGSSYFFFYFFH